MSHKPTQNLAKTILLFYSTKNALRTIRSPTEFYFFTGDAAATALAVRNKIFLKLISVFQKVSYSLAVICDIFNVPLLLKVFLVLIAISTYSHTLITLSMYSK